MYVTRAFPQKEQMEMCLRCPLQRCSEQSKRCLIRRRVNELLRIRYWKNVERSRATRRKAAIPPEQYEKKRQYMKKYYQECKQVIFYKMECRS